MTASVWLVIVLALVAANLPFVNQRWFAVRPVPRQAGHRKARAWRLLELFVLYAVVGLVAGLLEGRLGQRSPQGWEFYAITGALFVTLAFPGFTYQYLLRRSRH
ncbi:MAG: DUF2818 family protein [Comamonas sp.]